MPHCAAMCSAPCAAVTARGGRTSVLAFQLGRLTAYAMAGAAVSASVSTLSGWSSLSPALRPLWTLINAMALALGVWLLLSGRQPAWLSRLGKAPAPPQNAPGGWQRVRWPAHAAGAGLAWVAWPCGLLQSGLVVAALCSTAAGGALAMGGFALASMPGLLASSWIWKRLTIERRRDGAESGGLSAGVARHVAGALPLGRRISADLGASAQRLAIRVAGLLLAGASAWAMGHQFGPAFVAFCRTL